MKIWLLSDLHLGAVSHWSSAGIFDEIPSADIAVVAGDVTDGDVGGAMHWLAATIGQRMPVIFVLGNHEFYGNSVQETMIQAQRATHETGVIWLENETVVIDGVRFIGTTLWTDYDLYAGGSVEHRQGYMKAARHALQDHRQITLSMGSMNQFLPVHARAMHLDAVEYINCKLSENFAGKTVVVTHHAPHRGSIHPGFVGDPITPAFVSDLSPIIEKYQPALWVHGHTHSSVDYKVGHTRIICNPRGYGGSKDFNPALVIDTDELGTG